MSISLVVYMSISLVMYTSVNIKGCRGIVFTHGVRTGGQLGGRADFGKKFVRAVSQKP